MYYPTLRKRHYQLFFKRLRKWYGKPIRYFGTGEYGSKTQRPHYHFIIFGLKLDDLKLYGRNGLKQPMYTSNQLDKI